MKICIFGAGAVGGYLGAKLSRAGAEVSLVARGDHLAAMRRHGLRLIDGDEEVVVHPPATDDAHELGPQDYVVVTLKAHAVPAAIEAMAPLLGPGTAVVPAANGIPWWYFHELEGPWRDRRVMSVDADGRQWQGIGPERAIGCVIYAACEVVAPGVVVHEVHNRFLLGEPGGERTARVERLSEVLGGAGLEAPVRAEIRDDIWMKLWGNLAFSPISALTGATLAELVADEGVLAVARTMMGEAQAVAEALGVRFADDIDGRIRVTAQAGAHKTSMLQDLEKGRPLEIDPITGVVAELGRLTGVATPTVDMIYALAVRRARQAGCYPERERSGD